MSRLTKRKSDGDIVVNETLIFHPHTIGFNAVEKPAHYEDLEEQGRLIELPCKPNEIVWVGHKQYSFGEYFTQVRYNNEAAIIKAMQDGFVIGYTKEEAEAKLRELNTHDRE